MSHIRFTVFTRDYYDSMMVAELKLAGGIGLNSWCGHNRISEGIPVDQNSSPFHGVMRVMHVFRCRMRLGINISQSPEKS
jgi:hypothetical protein